MQTLLLVLACRPDPLDTPGGHDDATGTDDSTGIDDSSAGDSGSDDSSPDDSDPDDSGTATPLELTTPTWALDDDIGSLVRVTWEQSGAATTAVEFQVAGETTWQSSPAEERTPGEHSEWVLGVPFDTDVTVRIRAGGEAEKVTSEQVAATTGPLPKGVSLPALVVADEAAWVTDDRWLLLGVSVEGSDTGWKVIVDRQGRVVWAHPTPVEARTNAMQLSADGAFILWDNITYRSDEDPDGLLGTVERATLDGTIVETIATPGIHHTFKVLPDGAVVWGGQMDGVEVVREHTPDGKWRVLWNCTDYWEAHAATVECDGNGLYYDAEDDTVYFSTDNMETIVELVHETGELLHAWGNLQGAWHFAKGSPIWTKQHSPTRTAEGYLMVSDYRAINDSELVAREYRIDDKNQRLELVWECGEGSGVNTPHGGEAFRLSNGNTLMNHGPGALIRELQPDCTVVWQLEWAAGSSLSKSTFIGDLYALVGGM